MPPRKAITVVGEFQPDQRCMVDAILFVLTYRQRVVGQPGTREAAPRDGEVDTDIRTDTETPLRPNKGGARARTSS